MQESNQILVTGGAGFIGSHVVDRLVDAGYTVRIIDNLSTGKLAYVDDQRKSGQVSFVKGDIRELEVVRKCVHDVDAVIHLAAITNVPFSVKHPSLTYETNVAGTLNLLNSCVDREVEKFIFISSCSVYGEPDYLPVDENHPTRPVSPYAASKLAAEHYCRIFHERWPRTIVLRLFNVYGPRQCLGDYGGVIGRFVERMRRRLPLVIYGDGSQTRDFVHVWDVAEAIVQMLEAGDVSGEIFNVGYGKPVSLNELARAVLKFADVDLDVVYEQSRLGDLKHSFADISKAEKMLSYKPKLPLEDGLQTCLTGS